MESVVYRKMAYAPYLYDYGAPVLKADLGGCARFPHLLGICVKCTKEASGYAQFLTGGIEPIERYGRVV